MSRTLRTLTANISGTVREEKLLGRNYLVAPVTMIKEGVLHGNNGGMFYANSRINRGIDRWNGAPLTYGHPEDENGNKISARSPDVINEYSLGFVFNTSFDNALRGEAWFDVEVTNNKDPKLLNKIRKGKQIELSTGLFTSAAKSKGSFNGKPYSKKLQNYQPDHLAILTNEKGACSVEDGCGVLVNSDGSQKETPLTANEMSHSDLRDALNKLVRENIETDGGYTYVMDVYKNHFIFEAGTNYFRMGYSTKGDKVSLKDEEPTPVVRSVTYKEVKTDSNDSMTMMVNAYQASGTDKTFSKWVKEDYEEPEDLETNEGCGKQCGCDKCQEKYGVAEVDIEFAPTTVSTNGFKFSSNSSQSVKGTPKLSAKRKGSRKSSKKVGKDSKRKGPSKLPPITFQVTR